MGTAVMVAVMLAAGAGTGWGGARGAGSGVHTDSVPEGPVEEVVVAGGEVDGMAWRPEVAAVVEGAWHDGSGVLQLVTAGWNARLGEGLDARVELMGKWGHDGLPFPASQGLSSLDAGDFGGIGAAWAQWRRGPYRVKAGWVDGNTEFASASAAGSFANPSFGLSPALSFLPSYPEPAPSANVFAAWSGVEAGVGFYRAGGSWSGVIQATGGVSGSPLRWSVGWGGHLVRDSASAGFAIVESAVGAGELFAKVAGSRRSGLVHLGSGYTRPVGSGGSRVGLAGSLVSGAHIDREFIVEAFIALRPAAWVVIQPDLQLRMAPGHGTCGAFLLRVVLER